MDELIDKTSNDFVEFLYADSFPDIPFGMHRVVAYQQYVTKAGKKMAYTVICDTDKNLLSVMAFPTMFHKSYGKCKVGAVVDVVLKQTQEGAYFYDNIL
jgi:hypothetical protein